MNKNTIIIIVMALVAGLGIGYAGGANRVPEQEQEIRQNVTGGHMMPDGTMMDMMTSMNVELRGKTGDAFDQAFLAEMIVHHQGAVEMAELALTNAKHKEIKDLANAIISAQNTEIAQMEAWQKSWYGR